MGKLSAVADRIKDTKVKLEAEADKLAAKLDDIDATAPKAFDRGHAFLDSQKAEVAEIEDTLRQLSNLPLDRLPEGSGNVAGASNQDKPILPRAPQLNSPAATPAGSGGTGAVKPFP